MNYLIIKKQKYKWVENEKLEKLEKQEKQEKEKIKTKYYKLFLYIIIYEFY